MICAKKRFCAIVFGVESERQQIEELKQLVRRNIEVSTETSKLVHSMQRQARWSSIFRIIRIVVLIALAGGVYLYLQPYVEQIRDAYDQVRGFIPGGN